MNVVLIGFMGTGKSAIGRALAQRLGWAHMDTDTEIERRFGKKIRLIFAQDGEAEFRQAETKVLQEISVSDQLILSTGGGTPLRQENAALLAQIGTIVLLTTPPERIAARVGKRLAERPLLAGWEHDPLTRVRQLLQERTPRYEALADYRLETATFASPQAAASHLISHLRLNPTE